jgi:precorrin-4 methylase
MKNDFGKSFTEYFELKRKSGRASLRRKQWQMADNNPTMAIWLGKQYLNQTDKSVVENHNLNTEMPTIVVDDSVQDE